MFTEKLKQAVRTNNSLLCVGLDPVMHRLPAHLQSQSDAFFQFGKDVVDATADLVCAYKPQIAYYAAHSAEEDLMRTISYIKGRHPQLPVILDAKRGDIGSTAEQYAAEAFDRFGADAVTLNPYMGYDSVEPFLDRSDKGVIILCRTSNPGAVDFQDLAVSGAPLYETVARTVSEKWNRHNNCALVVGATAPEQLLRVRNIVGDMPVLVPGVGAQGGDLEAILQAGLTSDGEGVIINASRSIIFAGESGDYPAAIRGAAHELQTSINRFRQ